MVRLDLFDKIGIDWQNFEGNSKELIRLEKLLIVEGKMNDSLSHQDVEDILHFLKSDWHPFKGILFESNVQVVLNNKGSIEMNAAKLTVKEPLLSNFQEFLGRHFHINITNFFTQEMQNGRWEELHYLIKQYPFLFYLESEFLIHESLSNKFGDSITLMKTGNVPASPEAIKRHYLTQNSFYNFAMAFDKDLYYSSILEIGLQSLRCQLDGHISEKYNFYSTVHGITNHMLKNEFKNFMPKRRLFIYNMLVFFMPILAFVSRFFSKSSENAKLKDQTKNGIAVALLLFVVWLEYLLFQWKPPYFWIHLVVMILIGFVYKFEDFIKEEEVEDADKLKHSLKSWRFRKRVLHTLVRATAGVLFAIPVIILYSVYIHFGLFWIVLFVIGFFIFLIVTGSRMKDEDETEKTK